MSREHRMSFIFGFDSMSPLPGCLRITERTPLIFFTLSKIRLRCESDETSTINLPSLRQKGRPVKIPTQEEVNDLMIDFNNRRIIPRYVWDVIDSFPSGSHPMAILSAAVMSLERESHFNILYKQGMSKMDYWDATYEDAINLMAKMPLIGAYIYNKLYKPEKGHKNPPCYASNDSSS